MSKKWMVCVACCLCGCFAHHAMMTNESFASITIGTPIQKVVEQNGPPYSQTTQGPGLEEYMYMERVTAGNRLVYENHFILRVQNGTIVGKTQTKETVPAFDLIYQDDPNHNQYP